MIIFVGVIVLLSYFVFRYFLLRTGLKQIEKEMNDIQKDMSQNQVIHLPFPDKQMSRFLESTNQLLKEVQVERGGYIKKEKQLHQQVENISHDLRTPLTVILGYIKWLERDIEKEEKKEYLKIIEEKAELMSQLIEQFYGFSRLSANDFALSMEEVEFGRVLKENFLGHLSLLERRQLKIGLEMPEETILVMGDTLAIERILFNLFQNVERYAKSYLKITMKVDGKEVRVSFENDLISDEEQDFSRIFDRFYKQDGARQTSGTGLGLTVAQSLAEQMGGRLEVDYLSSDAAIVFTWTLHRIC